MNECQMHVRVVPTPVCRLVLLTCHLNMMMMTTIEGICPIILFYFFGHPLYLLPMGPNDSIPHYDATLIGELAGDAWVGAT